MADLDELLQQASVTAPGRRPIARHAPPGSDLRNDRVATEWEDIDMAFRTVLSIGVPFTLADVAKAPSCCARIHDVAKEFKGRADLPAAIAQDIRPEVEALVLDRTECALKQSAIESFSIHAMTDEDYQLLDIARLDEAETPVARARAVTETALKLRDESKLLLSSRAPILAVQPDAMSDPIRRMLAQLGVGYALRLTPQSWFSRIELDLDAADDGPDDYTVEQAFEYESRLPGRESVPVIPMRHLLDDATPRARITEYLVRIPEASSYGYFVARPVMTRRSPSIEDFDPTMKLAHKASRLPTTPLANEYGAHLFHHPNFEPWETVIAIVARAAAALSTVNHYARRTGPHPADDYRLERT